MESHCPEDTWRIAADMLPRLPARTVIALHGNLGSGKTCFVQGLARALGIHQPVTSPTFTLIREYRGSRHLRHLDLYRLAGNIDVWLLGFEEYLEADGITAIEWAERAPDVLPADTIHIRLEAIGEASRIITVTWPEASK
jgi:tRNA threonylcarbamoyladenosine biosynthesis protein TsaE